MLLSFLKTTLPKGVLPVIRNFLVVLTVYLLLALFYQGASAQDLDGESFEYYGENQLLRDVLTAIATHSRLGVTIHEDIVQEFNGHLKRRNSRDALNYLASTYDLVWYSDGATLFVDPINAMQSRMFSLDYLRAGQLKRTMQALQIWDERFDWRALDTSSILMASGPPRYLELVEETIALLSSQMDSTHADALQLHIFQLKHASAADRKVTVRGEETILPGVASLLSRLLKRDDTNEDGGMNLSQDQSKVDETPTDDANANSDSGTNSGARSGADSGTDAQSNSDSETETTPDNQASDEKQQARASAAKALKQKQSQAEKMVKGSPHPLAAIFADQSTNSVIVQDFSSRLLLYSDLIAQLDKPREQLEISLLIIDLSTNSLDELGVDWAVAQREVGGSGIIELILPNARETDTDTLTRTNADFLATVTALESQGKARVTSRPAVVTENGIEAVLDNNETFFVRIQGERVAELEEITYGTLLQVTPRIIPGDMPYSIYLDVNIEDANRLLDGGVESLPTIRNTQINTRTSVPDGASLLIGGYYREANSTNSGSVPLLGDLPLMGRLFRHSGSNNTQLVRLFMLSPRVLNSRAFHVSYNEDVSRSFTLDQQIREVSDLSNFNPELHRLAPVNPCESAIKARQRRNRYAETGYETRIADCRDINGDMAFRVVAQNCDYLGQQAVVTRDGKVNESELRKGACR